MTNVLPIGESRISEHTGSVCASWRVTGRSFFIARRTGDDRYEATIVAPTSSFVTQVTREQVVAFARHLLDIAGEPNATEDELIERGWMQAEVERLLTQVVRLEADLATEERHTIATAAQRAGESR